MLSGHLAGPHVVVRPIFAPIPHTVLTLAPGEQAGPRYLRCRYGLTEVLKVLGAGRYRGGTGTPRYGTGVLRYCGCSVLMRHRARADPEISLSGGGGIPN